MQSKPSMASAIAILSKLPAEIYIGGAGDESSRLVLSYAESRRERMRARRDVHYFPHWKVAHASRLAGELTSNGHALALIGHSWGADSVLQVARSAKADVFLVGADPVAKPVTRATARDARPAAAMRVLHVDANPPVYDRSDYVKAAGFLTGGGIPRAFRTADVRIVTQLNHWNFRGMMQAKGEDDQSAEDWLGVFPDVLSRTAC